MSFLGVHFALSEEDVTALRSFEDEGERLYYVQGVIEEQYLASDKTFAAESDKAWDAMHRALTDGSLGWDNGEYPLNHVILVGELLYDPSDYIMSLKTPRQVQDIAVALTTITEEEFRRRYFSINLDSYHFDLTEEDFGYTWEWFQEIRDFYLRSASAGRYVLFTADQ